MEHCIAGFIMFFMYYFFQFIKSVRKTTEIPVNNTRGQ